METRLARRSAVARLCTCVVLTLGLTGCTWLYGPAVELPKDIPEAVAKPGLGARALLRAQQSEFELASWGTALHAAIESLGASVDPSQEVVLRAAIRRAYGPQRLFDRMSTAISSVWDAEAAREVFAFHESWLGQRILRAHSNRHDVRRLAKFQNWSEHLDLASVPSERVELLRRIDRALLTSQTAVWLNRAMLDSGLAAIVEGIPASTAEPFRELRVRYAGEEPALYPIAAEQVLRWNLYAFRWISDSDLERYARLRGVGERAVVGGELRSRVPRHAFGCGRGSLPSAADSRQLLISARRSARACGASAREA